MVWFPWRLRNFQQSEETSYETILTVKTGISSNLPKHFTNGRTKTRWFISKWKIHCNTGIRNETAYFELSRKGHASVFTVKRMTTNHQNVAKSPHRWIAKSFWPRRSFVLIVLTLVHHRNAKVPHVKPVVNGIILQSAVCQRKWKLKECWQLINLKTKNLSILLFSRKSTG